MLHCTLQWGIGPLWRSGTHLFLERKHRRLGYEILRCWSLSFSLSHSQEGFLNINSGTIALETKWVQRVPLDFWHFLWSVQPAAKLVALIFHLSVVLWVGFSSLRKNDGVTLLFLWLLLSWLLLWFVCLLKCLSTQVRYGLYHVHGVFSKETYHGLLFKVSVVKPRLFSYYQKFYCFLNFYI